MRLMRTLSICAAALAASVVTSIAADMPEKARPGNASPVVASNPFSGVYVGGNVGYASIDTDPSILNDSLKGVTWGGHIGFQVQKGWLVGGIEAGFTNFSNVKVNGFGCDCYVGDLLAKVGFTPAPSLLVYAVGGGFWHSAGLVGLPQFGWTVGGGIDWLPINDHWVTGPRYQYRRLDIPNSSPDFGVFSHEIKWNLAYKF